MAYSRDLCPQRWWPVWGLGLVSFKSQATASCWASHFLWHIVNSEVLVWLTTPVWASISLKLCAYSALLVMFSFPTELHILSFVWSFFYNKLTLFFIFKWFACYHTILFIYRLGWKEVKITFYYPKCSTRKQAWQQCWVIMIWNSENYFVAELSL